MIMSIDPGLEYFAAAFWLHGNLIKADFYEAESTNAELAQRALYTGNLFEATLKQSPLDAVSLVVFECPVIYPKSKAPPTDIMALYGAVVAMASICTKRYILSRFVEPRKWKGNVPKEVFGKRIEAKLMDKERKLAQLDRFPKTKRHDVVDAIGIGLWHLGRMR